MYEPSEVLVAIEPATPPREARVRHRQELPETADHQVVTVRAVEAQHINHGFPLSGINDLTNAKQRFAPRDGKEVGNPRVRGGGINFFVGIAQLYFVIALERGEQGLASQRGREQIGELRVGEVASFEC